jgi:hypothetical protein
VKINNESQPAQYCTVSKITRTRATRGRGKEGVLPMRMTGNEDLNPKREEEQENGHADFLTAFRRTGVAFRRTGVLPLSQLCSRFSILQSIVTLNYCTSSQSQARSIDPRYELARRRCIGRKLLRVLMGQVFIEVEDVHDVKEDCDNDWNPPGPPGAGSGDIPSTEEQGVT